jgi:hypothetical protein
MTVSTAQTEPAKRPRRRAAAAVFAVLFLLIGAGLLWYSFFWQAPRNTSSAAPSPTALLSPTVQTLPAMPTPRPSGATGTPPPVVVTTVVVVTSYVNPQASATQDSGVLALVTTVSGLLASLAGIVSAIVSVRAPRQR